MVRSIARRFLGTSAVLLSTLAPQVVSAQTWAVWNPSASGTATGTLGATTVSFNGSYNNVFGTGGTNYWAPSGPYTGGGQTAPTNTSFVQVVAPTNGTITFGAAVTNPYIALISVGQPGVRVSYTFDSPFTVLSNNNSSCAFWGCGSFTVSNGGLTLNGNEFSGLLQFTGTFTSITVTTQNSENWHGFSVGVDGIANNVVPEPSTYALLSTGLIGIGVLSRRRRRNG